MTFKIVPFSAVGDYLNGLGVALAKRFRRQAQFQYFSLIGPGAVKWEGHVGHCSDKAAKLPYRCYPNNLTVQPQLKGVLRIEYAKDVAVRFPFTSEN